MKQNLECTGKFQYQVSNPLCVTQAVSWLMKLCQRDKECSPGARADLKWCIASKRTTDQLLERQKMMGEICDLVTGCKSNSEADHVRTSWFKMAATTDFMEVDILGKYLWQTLAGEGSVGMRYEYTLHSIWMRWTPFTFGIYILGIHTFSMNFYFWAN